MLPPSGDFGTGVQVKRGVVRAMAMMCDVPWAGTGTGQQTSISMGLCIFASEASAKLT